MIELPDSPALNGATASLIDWGIPIKGAAGGASLRVDRPGSRFRIAVSFPIMTAAEARVFVSRLLRGKAEGIRIEYPLLRQTQSGAGSPVVDGAGQGGTTINLRGFTPEYGLKEGAWISIEDANGQHYLHNVAAFTRADSSGEMALPIWPELRVPFADGDTVHAARPMIEGLVEGDAAEWQLQLGDFVQLGFTIEEAA